MTAAEDAPTILAEMFDLAAERDQLCQQVEDLREFEHEYRDALTGHLEALLRRLKEGNRD